ncbi:MAG: 50S ribosomal protein L1 [Patescibacteria group bacterium]
MSKKDELETAGTEEVSEKELLKEAEEREKLRKEKEEAEKEAQKEEEAEQKKEEKAEKEAKRQQTQRRKPRHGKKYRALAEKVEKDKEYSIDESIELAINTNPSKFDATVEMHVKINPKEKSVIRGMVKLPGGVTKEKKVLEVTIENVDEVVASIKAGKIDFDIMIADIKVMPKLAQLAKVLGPKGLMPSPKAGTVVPDVKKAAEEMAGGKVEYRADKQNIVHMAIGKISFGPEKIKQNFEAILSHLPKKIDSIYLTTTMGPSIRVAKK